MPKLRHGYEEKTNNQDCQISSIYTLSNSQISYIVEPLAYITYEVTTKFTIYIYFST